MKAVAMAFIPFPAGSYVMCRADLPANMRSAPESHRSARLGKVMGANKKSSTTQLMSKSIGQAVSAGAIEPIFLSGRRHDRSTIRITMYTARDVRVLTEETGQLWAETISDLSINQAYEAPSNVLYETMMKKWQQQGGPDSYIPHARWMCMLSIDDPAPPQENDEAPTDR